MTKKNTKPSKKKVGTKKEAEPKQEDEIKDDFVMHLTATPHVLKEDIINLWSAPIIKERDYVGPPTPNYSHLKFDRELIAPVSISNSNLDMLKIPYVRKMGIKSCMELLGRFFNCNLYQTNQLQFWFIDTLTDCLWKVQDDYQLPDDDQKKVLEYFLYFFKIIIDTDKNYSRKHFLKIFKEAILLIADLIEEGCLIIPPPNQLFSLNDNLDNECDSDNSFTTSTSTITNSGNEEIDAHVGVKMENVVHITKLKNRISTDNIFTDVSKSSSFEVKKVSSDDDSLLTHTVLNEKSPETIIKAESYTAASITYDTQDQKTDLPETYNITDFYQADLRTPPRFLSSELAFARYRAKEIEYLADGGEEYEFEDVDDFSSSLESANVGIEHNADEGIEKLDKSQLSDISKYLSETDTCKFTISMPVKKKSKDFKSIPSRKSKDGSTRARQSALLEIKQSFQENQSVPRKTSLNSVSDTASSNTINRLLRAKKKLNLEKALKSWRDYNITEQRIRNMSDSNIGWQINDDSLEKADSELVTQSSESVQTDTSVWQKLVEEDNGEATRIADERKRFNIVIASAITDCVFEYLYDNFHFALIKLAFQSTPYLVNQHVNDIWKRPKVPKGEFSRPARIKVKSPKVKKEKKAKGKSAKGSKKSAKKSSSKKSSKKSSGKKSSGKSSKKSEKLSKAELNRLKMEKALLEEEQRKIEEDKRFMFPLVDAATDELFQNMFDNWIRPKTSNKKAKKKK